MHLIVSSAKWRPFSPGPNLLIEKLDAACVMFKSNNEEHTDDTTVRTDCSEEKHIFACYSTPIWKKLNLFLQSFSEYLEF